MSIRISVRKLIREHKKHNPGSQYFSKSAMRNAGESRFSMRVMPVMAMIEGRFCIVLRSIQNRNGCKLSALAYFDYENYELVAGR